VSGCAFLLILLRWWASLDGAGLDSGMCIETFCLPCEGRFELFIVRVVWWGGFEKECFSYFERLIGGRFESLLWGLVFKKNAFLILRG
jgi:hypothetical protein